MDDNEKFNRQIRQAAFTTVGLVAALVFGIILLASGDWIPGTIIVAASLVGLARQLPVIAGLCADERAPSPPTHKSAH
jgi:hypothetical protein